MKDRDANALRTKSQIKYIYLCAKKLGLDNDLLHEVVYSCTRKKSISKLSITEAGKVIDVLSKEAFPDAPKKRSNVIYLMSAAQKQKIQELGAKMGWDDTNIDNLSLHTYKRPIAKLTSRQAGGLIEALKSIIERGAYRREEKR